MNTATVTSIRSNMKEIRPLGDSIELIISRIEKNSVNTAKNYRGFYKQFFMYNFNKNYTDCKWDDFLSLRYDNILEYVNYLEVSCSQNTIKTKIASLQSLAKELKKINHDVDTSIYDVKLEKRVMEKNEYGSFTEDEIYELLEYTKNLHSEKAKQQYLFFKLSIATAHRLASILNLKWSDITSINENGTDIWVINVKDKTSCFTTPISNELYEELYELYNGDMDSKVIQVSDKTLSKTLSQFCKDNGIDQKGRKLVIHSIKKASADICYKTCDNDIVAVAKHLHHSNIQTAYNSYLNKNSVLSESHSYNMFQEKEDIDDVLGDLSKEELLSLIKKCSQTTISDILKKAKNN